MTNHYNVASRADEQWRKAYYRADNAYHHECSPRGMRVREFDHATHVVDMRYPVVTYRARRLNYRFMAAEALWILAGGDRLADLTATNPRMVGFSDDGVTLSGAYGPRIAAQTGYVVGKLLADPDTRQATMTLWTPCPAPSKDVPCTVAMDFKVRDGRLNLHVFMRSSDVWLGLCYDIFSFSCVAMMVRNLLNAGRADAELGPTEPVDLGTLFLTAASSHVYEEHWGKDLGDASPPAPPVPEDTLASLDGLLDRLEAIASSRRGDPCRWWEDTP